MKATLRFPSWPCRLAGAVVVAAMCAVVPAWADAQLDSAKSTLVAVSKQMGVPVEGSFRRFTAQLDFDPAKPAAGSARLAVEVASYDLGDASFNDSVAGPDWFAAKQFPQATFVSSAITPAGANHFQVKGNLTIKGHTETVVVPVVLSQQGATQTFDGTLPIKRLAFNIGTGEWKDTSTVADEVLIKFHIVVVRK